MSLNLGPAAYDAIQNLKNSRDWANFRDGLQAAMERHIHQALDAPMDHRLDATGYARALRDLVVALELNQLGASAPRNYRPPVRAKADG